MPAVVRKGDTGGAHECFPSHTCTEGSGNVIVNGKETHRQGDAWDVHTCTHPKTPHGSHSGNMSGGSSSVNVNGKPIARVGDGISCGGSAGSGSPNVFAGG